jgi:lathosterol oxidase
MDVALDVLDPLIFDKAYSWILPHLENAISFLVFGNSHLTVAAAPRSLWPRDNIYRQCISILLITQVGVTILYLAFSGLSYYFLFDRRLEYHPRFLKNQVRQEIKSSLIAIPFINVLTLPWFLGELRGYSLLYSDNRHGWVWLLLSFFLYMAFNDVAIYWIHRLEHHPCLYKHIHKPHHKWISESF